jgi:HSP20 family protein
MATITRYPMDEAFDELVRGFFVRPMNLEGSQPPVQFRVDVTENENAYIVRAEIPGVRKEDINISIEGDQVAISAEVKHEQDAKEGERVLRQERYYGKVYRGFALGQPVDENAANARYTDGVLELTLPKKAAAQTRRIAIQ